MKISYSNLIKDFRFLVIAILTLFATSCQATTPPITIKRLGGDHSMIHVATEKTYLLLPVEQAWP